jgi:primary-amine oxidase
VIGYLHEQSDLNLTASDTAGPWDNQISVVETLPVNKTDAIPYLSAGGEEPTRWARVSIMFGVTEEPYVEDYKVGPLPKPTSYEKLGYTSTKGSSKILNYDADSDALYEYIYSITSGVQDIVQDLCNGTVTGAEDDTLDVWGIDPLWHENSRVMNWLGFWRYDDIGSDGETLLPQGLYFKIDMTGRDPSKWSLIGWLYNDIYYTSTADFRAAWSSPSFEKAGVHNIPSEYIALPGFKEEDSPPLDVRPHPFPIQPAEARFEVDYDAQYVTWMDFSFYIAFGRDRGVRLFDIKYKGERVMYELGLEEAVATYAGNDPVQSGVGLDLPCGNDLGSLYESLSIQTAYLDTYYGFGPYAFALLPAYE